MTPPAAQADRRALRLVVSDAELAAVLDLAAGQQAAAADVPTLTADGWVTDGAPVGAFADGLAALTNPVCELALQRGDRHGRGAANERFAILIVPGAQPGTHQLAVLPTDFLPDALARLNDLGPRPGATPAASLQYAAADFRRILDGRDGALAGELAPDRARDGASALISGMRELWSVELRWAATGAAPARLEVLDSDAGVWVVVRDGTSVELRPSTPTAVFRRLTELIARDGRVNRSGGENHAS